MAPGRRHGTIPRSGYETRGRVTGWEGRAWKFLKDICREIMLSRPATFDWNDGTNGRKVAKKIYLYIFSIISLDLIPIVWKMIKPSWLDKLGSEWVFTPSQNPIRLTLAAIFRHGISGQNIADLPTIV